METGLKRIEATLGRLTAQGSSSVYPSSSPSTDQSIDQVAAQTQVKELIDVETGLAVLQPSVPAKAVKSAIQAFPFPKELPQSSQRPIRQPVSLTQPPSADVQLPTQPIKRKPARSGNKSPAKSSSKPKKAAENTTIATVQPFPAEQRCPETPALPKSKPPSFSSHRHAVNPNLAVGLLKEVETVVLRWQLELEQTVLEIQALYLEGPIVDGWLESHPYGSPQVMQAIGTATLRHAEIDRLMEYVEEICRIPQTLDLGEVPRTGYRLCGLDADGRLWSRPCPPQQVPYVSLAIARYQKLRILLAKKQNLESRLTQLVQSLTMLHGQMQDQI